MNKFDVVELAPALGGAAAADLSPCMGGSKGEACSDCGHGDPATCYCWGSMWACVGCGFDHPTQGYCQECRDNNVPALPTTCKGCGSTHEVALALQELGGLCWECYMPHA